MKKIITAMVLLFSLSANAEFFKCLDANGKTAYQNTPYPDDKGYFFDLDKNTKISVEEYKKNKEQEQERIKQEFEATKKQRNRNLNHIQIIIQALLQVLPQGQVLPTVVVELFIPGQEEVNTIIIVV